MKEKDNHISSEKNESENIVNWETIDSFLAKFPAYYTCRRPALWEINLETVK